jgi:membrane-bound serine protease (ClpP class)
VRAPVRIAALIAAAAVLALGGAAVATGQGDATGGTAGTAADATSVPSIELDGEISPATAGWIGTALADAADERAPLAIIRLDTPGGLDTSMRDIVKDIIAAPMPVVVYVSPNGARAGSAGVFITQAADVAAMAPETNIGSATPITSTGGDIGGTLGRKITNDASAFVRALATVHGRNPDLAEQMVREATNVTAREALDAGLIDLIASDQDALLADLDGFVVKGPKRTTLDTAGYTVAEQDMPLRYEVLQVLVNPNVAFLLLLLGLIGITLEIFSPGAVIPGLVGGLCLVLGLIGTLQLPVAAVGVLLLALAFILFVAEAHLPTGGLLGVAGIAALIAGGLLMFNTGDGAPSVSPWVAVPVAIVFGGGLLAAGQRVIAARRQRVQTGVEEIVGDTGTVRTVLDPRGQVYLEGALWRARSAYGAPIEAGTKVIVEEIDGLTLVVRPVGAPARTP